MRVFFPARVPFLFGRSISTLHRPDIARRRRARRGPPRSFSCGCSPAEVSPDSSQARALSPVSISVFRFTYVVVSTPPQDAVVREAWASMTDCEG